MIISTTDLNNIENKIITPQIEGIEFIIGTDVNSGIELNANYNDIINILGARKLPIIKYNNRYIFISNVSVNEEGYCLLQTNNSGYEFGAENMTTNLSGGRER